MSIRVVTVRPVCLLAVALVVGILLQDWHPSLAAQEPDRALATSVEGFLTTWLVQRDPAAAAERFVSRSLTDERFVPAQWFDVAE